MPSKARCIPNLKISMDMGILMKVPSGAICTLSLSFNNDGPFGTFFRYICDNGTYLAYYDDLSDGKGNKIDLTGVAVSFDGIELQDREFFSAIEEKREPNSSLAQVLPAMRTLDALDRSLDGSPRASIAPHVHPERSRGTAPIMSSETPYGFPPYVIERVMSKRGRLAVFDRFDPKALRHCSPSTCRISMSVKFRRCSRSFRRSTASPNAHARTRRTRRVGRHECRQPTARAAGHVYHDNFFTPEKGANHRDQLSPGHPGHEFHMRISTSQPGDEIVYKSRFSPFIQGASNLHERTASRRASRTLIVCRHGDEHVLRVRGARCDDARLSRGDGVGCQRRALRRRPHGRTHIVLPKFRRRPHHRRSHRRPPPVTYNHQA